MEREEMMKCSYRANYIGKYFYFCAEQRNVPFVHRKRKRFIVSVQDVIETSYSIYT
jgi:YHS domain-containing protein